MEAKLRVIASGSSGNALFVALGDTKLLIDAGLSLRNLERALRDSGEDLSAFTALLLTHEHTDHVRAVPRLRDRFGHVPIYATRGTARSLARRTGIAIESPPLASGASRMFGAARVTPFATSHDAAEPVGLRIDYGDFALGVATDLGLSTPEVQSSLSGCRILILEANHDENLLRRGPYPAFLKRRIASPLGHLSNRQAAALAQVVAGPELEHVILAHLSDCNNTPELAVETVSGALDASPGVLVEAARRRRPGDLATYEVTSRPFTTLPPPIGPAQPPLFE